jgi:hypothetical protein
VGLLRIQQELAAILLEPEARKAFAKDPRGALKARGVKGRDLKLLAGLDPDDLAYFAQRREVDRAHALRADAPRAAALLETMGLKAYFRAHPYALEDPRAETDRFARWCRTAAREGMAPPVAADLAVFDAAVLRMLADPARATRPSKWPRRAPGVRLLRLGHTIGPALRSGDHHDAKPGDATVALRRTPDDVYWQGLTPLEEALLRSADGKATEAAWLKGAATASQASVAAARKAARGLVRDGLLAPPA